MFRSVGLPHGFCFLWNPHLLWLHVVSDSLIALAYFLIPLALIRIVSKRKDIPFNGIFFCFATFIVACGITHLMEVITLWHPIYWISGGLKALTAVVSLATFVLLLKLTPAILAIPHERDLARVNKELNSVLESTTMCVLAMDPEWKITYLNGNARRLLAVDKQVSGKVLWDAFPAQEQATRERLEKVMATRNPEEYEAYYEPLDLSTSVHAHPTESGGVTVFFNDVSEQKRLQRQLEVERALREQRIESLAQMAGGIAHEISNPLGIIHARANDLAEVAHEGESVPSEVVIAACTSMLKTSQRAMSILRGLRMFAREGTHDPMFMTSIPELIEQTVELVSARYRTHGVLLSIVPGVVPKIRCREVQIGQILLNMLNNSFDAIDGAGSTERWVTIGAAQAGECIQVDVVDSGPGVAPEHRQHLMEPFYTTKPLGAGMGVGLSLSRVIAHDHGGTLELTDVDGHTCFRLTLPVHAGESEAGVQAQPEGVA
jgi:two-component system NtrC family sensor kinase